LLSCLPLEPRFAGSNPAEDDGLLKTIQISARLHSEGKYKPAVPSKIVRHVKYPYFMKEISVG
jgi:hypothetical protein